MPARMAVNRAAVGARGKNERQRAAAAARVGPTGSTPATVRLFARAFSSSTASSSVVRISASTNMPAPWWARAAVESTPTRLRSTCPRAAASTITPPIREPKTPQVTHRMLDGAPEVWIGYERTFFETVYHRVANFIAGTLLPHQKKTPNAPYIRRVMAQMGAIESTLQLPASLE